MADKAFFEYKGISSLDMHMRIENDIAFPSPEADIEFIEVLGKDGELAIDNKRLKGDVFPIPVQLRLPEGVNVNDQATKISQWLKSDIGWFPLKFSGQSGFNYIAIMHERFNIQETLRDFGRTIITFKIKPYKMATGVSLITVAKGQTLTNPNKRESKPYIKVTGTGNITLTKNGVNWLTLYNVDNYIEIDSEAMVAYDLNGQKNDKMSSNLTPMFPLLTSGQNTINWTGTVTKVEINPRWEVII